MKGLAQFVTFDAEAFFAGKTLVVTKLEENTDYKTKVHLGTKVECVIIDDKTPYVFKEGNQFTNRYEKVTFKLEKDINIPLEAKVVPKGMKAKVYGEYRNLLSITCDDLVVVTPQPKTAAPIKREV
ncbi:hypothetical protein SAMN04487830_1591 [Pseudobutyrivibrio sp. OR37]|uniref:hypothetical protein n=1 Tax=Pseudobutyrivibrio sp. OR37 TaxID=1798186 RepID=UPI0008E90869|nr:hypothetical protein [Pseudobutyrivibrio sp. OR37]SFI40105.1 hypothetical protein SAMN04487830_1591 [Pseudobutyrivibrio sp. OR37]